MRSLNRYTQDAAYAKKYMGMTGAAKATATRHLTDLLEKQCLSKLEGGGRSTRYDINWP